MRRGRYGGTAGKARKHRDRSRADQDYENLLIHDWREPENAAQRERLIPIRRRSDFLPAVACSSDLEEPELGTQLDLPLGRSAAEDSAGRSHVVWPPEEAGPVQGSRLAAPVGPLCRSIIRFQPKTSTAAQHPSSCRRHRATPRRTTERGHAHEPALAPRITAAGFAYGCLLGSAAAATALVLLDSLL